MICVMFMEQIRRRVEMEASGVVLSIKKTWSVHFSNVTFTDVYVMIVHYYFQTFTVQSREQLTMSLLSSSFMSRIEPK